VSGGRDRPGMPMRPLTRCLIAAPTLVAGLVVFRLVQLHLEAGERFATPLDALVPFLPWTVWIYLAFFPFVVAAAGLAPAERFVPTLIACAAALAVGLVCFASFPAECPRPAHVGDGLLLAWLHGLDAPRNTMPSLHVAVTWLLCLSLRGTGWFVPAVAAAVAISASTMTLKQHHALDVAGGVALAAILTLAQRLLPWWRTGAIARGRSDAAARPGGVADPGTRRGSRYEDAHASP
jgi:membrane-associated phospholipid phosphatase